MQYDRDVWMQLHEMKDGYDYICTHVDDFKSWQRSLSGGMTKSLLRFYSNL
jgi:hypothetical protein